MTRSVGAPSVASGASGTDEATVRADGGTRSARVAWYERVELASALAIMAASSLPLLRFLRAYGRESLWGDELTSVFHTSGRGPMVTVTTYAAANNHVFFNLLNALTPGAGSVDPVRARLWSILPTLAALALLVYECFRRRWYLGGALLFAVFATNTSWLELSLQARGYGLLGLAAAVSCAAVWRYLESASNDASGAPGPACPLVALAAASVLGTWTIPTFVLFAAPVWLLLLVTTRHLRVLAYGAAAGAAILVVYLPILGQVRAEMDGFEAQWGRTYTSPSAAAATLRTWLLTPDLLGRPLATKLLLAAVFVALPAATWLAPVPAHVRRLVGILVGATGIFLVACIAIGTTMPRTTAFVVVPVAVAAVVPGAQVLAGWRPARRDGPDHPLLAMLAVVLLTMFLVSYAIDRGRTFSHGPMEDWSTAAAYVERTSTDGFALVNNPPAATDIRSAYFSRPPDDLRPLLQRDRLADGTAVLYDLGRSHPGTLDFTTYAPVFAEVHVAQQRGRYLRILSAPPMRAHLAGVAVDGVGQPLAVLTDRLPSSGPPFPPSAAGAGTVVRVEPTPGTTARSVVLVTFGPVPSVEHIEVTPADGGPTSTLPPERVTGEHTISVALGDREVAHIDIVLQPTTDETAHGLREVWVNPPRDPGR